MTNINASVSWADAMQGICAVATFFAAAGALSVWRRETRGKFEFDRSVKFLETVIELNEHFQIFRRYVLENFMGDYIEPARKCILSYEAFHAEARLLGKLWESGIADRNNEVANTINEVLSIMR